MKNDLISRQAAIDEIREWKTRMTVEGLVDHILALPSAQPTNTQDILEYLDTVLHPIISPEHWNIYSELHDMISALPSAEPEYYDYSDIDDVWEFYAEEQDINLTDGAKQLKDAMWVGYRKGKQDAQTDWGKPVGDGRPLADSEVIPRLRDIQKQLGGSYAIDRAVEVLEGLQEAQPKIIRCKDCKHRYEDECPMYHVEWVEYDDDGYIDMDDVIYDYTEDDGYCFKAEG